MKITPKKVKLDHPAGSAKVLPEQIDASSDRGLVFVDIATERPGQQVQISTSSAACEECAWLRCTSVGWKNGVPGIEETSQSSIHMTRKEAKRIGSLLLAFAEHGDATWEILREAARTGETEAADGCELEGSDRDFHTLYRLLFEVEL